MVGNIAAVRAIPGRSIDNIHCWHCPYKEESLAHILGSCPHGERIRNSQHNKIRAAIAEALKNTIFTVYEEVHGISKTGNTCRIDIVFKDKTKGFIINPTVCFESCRSQPDDHNDEKTTIYNPTRLELSTPFAMTSWLKN